MSVTSATNYRYAAIIARMLLTKYAFSPEHWAADQEVRYQAKSRWSFHTFHLLNVLGRECRTILSQNPGIAWMGGRVWPLPGFFEGFVHMHWGPSKVIIYHKKLMISPQHCRHYHFTRGPLNIRHCKNWETDLQIGQECPAAQEF